MSQNSEDQIEKDRTGVCYLSSIPEGMNVTDVHGRLEKYEPLRVFLKPDERSKNKKKKNYIEGWIEFKDKLLAKLCEHELNGKPVGGRKNSATFVDTLWTIKYLKKFKWTNLTERLRYYEQKERSRLNAELAQTKRENDYIMKKFSESKLLNKKREKDEQFEENAIEFKQRKPLK